MSIDYQISRDPSNNWIVGPVAGCADFIATETAMAGLLTRSLQALPLLEPLMRVVAEEVKKKLGPGAMAAFQQFFAMYSGMDDMVKRLEQDDFALVNGHALIAIWSALETCIEDTVVLILMNDEESVRAAENVVQVRRTAEGFLTEDEARRMFRSLERRQRERLGVMESYDSILGTFGVERTPKTDYSVAISEINALRNSLMHRRGAVDDRAVSQAPTLQRALGTKIKIGRDEYLRYYQAVAGYTNELVKGVFNSRFIRFNAEPGGDNA